MDYMCPSYPTYESSAFTSEEATLIKKARPVRIILNHQVTNALTYKCHSWRFSRASSITWKLHSISWISTSLNFKVLWITYGLCWPRWVLKISSPCQNQWKRLMDVMKTHDTGFKTRVSCNLLWRILMRTLAIQTLRIWGQHRLLQVNITLLWPRIHGLLLTWAPYLIPSVS